jgi:hypothetical protein
MEDARMRVAELFEAQARSCARGGSRSPLYALLLSEVAGDLRRSGCAWDVLADSAADPEDSALALRLMAAVHRFVLGGEASELVPYYPSAGGRRGPEGAWKPFAALLCARAERLKREVCRPCQTNEVGRSAALVGGFLEVARRTGLPLRLLELGASAGLNLRWDRYRYEARGATWGDPDSAVRLCGFNTQSLPPFEVEARVAERRGCDPHPLDVASRHDRLLLRSFVWADQPARHRLLKNALDVAQRVPVDIDRAEAHPWIRARLAEQKPDVATVVFHSIVMQYLAPRDRELVDETIRGAGDRAGRAAPLAWLRMEPAGDHAEVRLALWPERDDRVVARSGFHGDPVTWVGD